MYSILPYHYKYGYILLQSGCKWLFYVKVFTFLGKVLPNVKNWRKCLHNTKRNVPRLKAEPLYEIVQVSLFERPLNFIFF